MGEQPSRAFSPTHVVILSAVLLVAVAGLVVGVLHQRAMDPRSGYDDGRTGGSEANRRAQKRSAEFVAALSRGDAATMRSLALSSDDRAQVGAFIAAFGGRQDVTQGVDGGDFAISSTITSIRVPCRNGSSETAIVVMMWKQTSFFSSDWFAYLHPPGEKGIQPVGCPAP